MDELVQALGTERRRAERSDEERANIEKRLWIAQAELARFNGRDWPRELDQAVAQRKAAQSEAEELRKRVTHLEAAMRSLTLAGFESAK